MTDADATAALPVVLELRDLAVAYRTRAGDLPVLPGLSLSLRAGEALGLVGESGCGKSTAAYAAIGHLGANGRVTGGQVLVEGRDLATLSPQDLRALRGNRVAMVFQDPMSSLNPTLTIGTQVAEVARLHLGASRAEARARAVRALEEVRLPDPEPLLARYPHQLSGGQQQRVVIAMALMTDPALLILDEPTTGLDVTVEAAVLDLVRDLRRKNRAAILFISHNPGTVVRLCDRIGVMYAGDLVEEGPINRVFAKPRHPYTRGLLQCIPTLTADRADMRLTPIRGVVPVPGQRPESCVFAPRCDHLQTGLCDQDRVPLEALAEAPDHRVRCLRHAVLPPWRAPGPGPGPGPGPESTFVAEAPAADADTQVLTIADLRKTYVQAGRPGLIAGRRRELTALDGLSFQAGRGQTLAIVGESGCGKSTLAKVLTGLEIATEGRIALDDTSIAALKVEARDSDTQRRLQMIFQNPDSTLNPSHSIGTAIARPLRRLAGLTRREARAFAERLLEAVNLPAEFARRKPRQLSGGQKQRVAIARAIAGDPDVLIADEPVSALDVSVQAAIINLLETLQKDRDATLLFISHDLAVVRYLADKVLVMYLGRIMELGTTAEVFNPPYHPYTEALLAAVPIADPRARQSTVVLEGRPPSPLDRPRGCPFASRCPRHLGPVCDEALPPEQITGGGHRIACHIPLSELAKLDPVITAAAAQ